MLQLLQTGFRLMKGEWINQIIEVVNGLQNGSQAASVTNLAQNGTLTRTPQIASAAGSNSQANATLITKALVIVTVVSATTRAVKLPAAATGLTVQINNVGATQMKVYPNTGDKIGAGATNAVGTAIAVNKGNIYTAQDATTWRVITGA
jgi:hypothetical protein